MLRYLLLPVACAAALTAALPPSALAQTVSAPAADDEALRNIQSNFARMAPPPRTMQSINQDLQQHRRPRANARMALRTWPEAAARQRQRRRQAARPARWPAAVRRTAPDGPPSATNP